MSKIRYFSINKRISESHSTYVMLKDLLFKRKQLREYSLITSGLFFLLHVQTLTLVNHFIFFFNFIFFQGIKAAGFISCLLFFTHPRNSCVVVLDPLRALRSSAASQRSIHCLAAAAHKPAGKWRWSSRSDGSRALSWHRYSQFHKYL